MSIFLAARPERAWLPEPLQALQFHTFSAALAAAGPTSDELLIVDDHVVGRLVLRDEASAVHVLEIALLPEWRSRGLGAAVMREVLHAAGQSGRAVTLSVAADNKALRFYERLGFRIVHAGGADHGLRWDGPALA